MRKTVRILTVLLSVAMLLSLGILSAGAEVYDQNFQLYLEKDGLLNDQIQEYNTKDTSDSQDCASKTAEALSAYKTAIYLLGINNQELKTNEINLTYEQGRAVGRLAWIYYSHPEAATETLSVYEEQKAIIDGKTYADIPSFFEGATPGVNGCYTALLSAIYEAKYEMLRSAEDSNQVKQMIDAAIDDVKNANSSEYLTYEDEYAANYKEHYAETVIAVTNQRNRDTVSDQLKGIFEILYPNAQEDYDNPSNPKLAVFFGKLDGKTEVADMNDILKDAVLGLLEDLKDGREIVDGYIDGVKAEVETLVTAATAEGVTAQPRPLFVDHETELARATLRADWHDEYQKTLNRIASYAGDGSALEEDAQDVYELTDGKLKTAEPTQWDAIYAEGEADLSEVIADAEAQAYTKEHGEILNKGTNEITTADLPAIENAIEDAEGLSDLARAKLADKLSLLGEKYKNAMKHAVAETGKTDSCEELRDQYIDELNDKIDALSVSNLTALKNQAKDLLAKAERIEQVLDRYAQILSAEGYDDYKENFKTAMEETATEACEDLTLAVAEGGQTLTQRLDKLTADAILNLDRQEAIARIYAAAGDSTLPEITQILTEAQNQISAATDRNAIPPLISATVKEIDGCLAKEEMTRRVEELKDEINAMEFLSDAEKEIYVSQAEDALASGLSVLENDGNATSALSVFDTAYTNCKNAAIKRNTANALVDKKAKSAERLTQVYEDMLRNKESYSPEALEELRSLYEQALAQINAYTNEEDLAALSAMVEQKIADLEAVYYSRLYTEDKLLADSSYDLLHPTGYNPHTGGYVGSVEATSGIPSGANLSILSVDRPDVIKLIREAAKNGRVRLADGSVAAEELLSRLSTCRLGAAMDISMGNVALPEGNVYSVSVLLSDEVKMADVIGVVYLCEDGSVEFYEITSEASLIRFTTTHFSNYYVVTDHVVNLLPVILILAALILCEIGVLIFLYWRRSKEGKESRREVLASVSPALFLLTKYTPKGGFWIIGAMSLAVLGLGGWIAYLILSNRQEELEEEELPEEETLLLCEEESAEEWIEELPEEEPKEEEVTEEPSLYEEVAELEASEEQLVLEGAEEQLVLEGAKEPMVLQAAAERSALCTAEEQAMLEASEEQAVLGAPEEQAVLGAPEEQAVLQGREEVPALMEAEPLPEEEEAVIYEGTFTDPSEDWIREMVEELPETETPTEDEIFVDIPEEEPVEEEILEEEPIEEELPVEEPVEEEIPEEEPVEEEIPEEEPVEEEIPEEEPPVDETAVLLGALKGMFGEEKKETEEDDLPWEENDHVSVRAEEVDVLMTDKEVKDYQRTATVPTERITGSKKAQVNLDTISAVFSDGDTVTLNALKEKKLVAKNVGSVKILARGELNKSLIVIAQDFSVAAVKMILLTGGQAIVTKPSEERQAK